MAGVFLCMQVTLSAFGCPLPSAVADAQSLGAFHQTSGAGSDMVATPDCHSMGQHEGAPEPALCKALCDSDTQASGAREAPADLQPVAMPLIVRTIEPLALPVLAGVHARAFAGPPPPPSTPLYLSLLVLRN